MAGGIETFNIPNFTFASGLKKDIQVKYQSFNAGATKGTVLIPTCYGGTIGDTMNLTGGALKDYHVIVVAMLGGSESTSSSNDKEFPKDYSLRYQDCINSQYALVQHLGIKSLEAVIGFSMGGQQAYYWAAMHGTGHSPFVKRAIVICGSAKTSGLNWTFLEGVVSTLIASADYPRYTETGVVPTEGIRAYGRAYAPWITSAAWFREEKWRQLGASSLQEWLHPPEGKGSFEGIDAEDLIVMVRLWQSGNIADITGYESYEKALEKIEAKMLLLPCQTDQYFVPEDNEYEAKYLRNAIYEPIPSIWGHMAGAGVDPPDGKWLDKKIAGFMQG